MSVNFQRFKNHLEASKPAVWHVAQWLSSLGYPVQVNPTFVAPSPDQVREYMDEGDLVISQRVEVKQLSREFSCREDWPFGSNFIVCAKHSYDLAKPKPMMYVILSRSGEHAAIVKTDTCREWKTGRRQDSRYINSTQEFYLAPLDCVKFVEVK